MSCVLTGNMSQYLHDFQMGTFESRRGNGLIIDQSEFSDSIFKAFPRLVVSKLHWPIYFDNISTPPTPC